MNFKLLYKLLASSFIFVFLTNANAQDFQSAFDEFSNEANVYEDILKKCPYGLDYTDKFFSILKKHGIKDINARDDKGFSILHYAAETDDLETLKVLIDFGCDINLVNSENNTPIDVALKKGNFCFAAYLLELFGKFNLELLKENINKVGKDGTTLLENSINGNFNNTAHLLLSLGATPPNLNNIFVYRHYIGMTELHKALLHGKLGKAENIIKNGIYINDNYNLQKLTPLHIAYMYGYDEIADLLIKHGANTHVLDIFEKTPNNYRNPSIQNRLIMLFSN